MAKITAKGFKTQDYVSKDILPGVVKARIIKLAVVKVENPRNTEGLPEYNVQIRLETKKPNPEFEGWDKDPQDPSKGKFEGQTKLITQGTWPIREFTYKKNGKKYTIDANTQILGILQEIAAALGKPKLLEEKQYQKEFNTWSDFIKQMNMDLSFIKNYVWWCLAGTKTKNKGGYVTYFLYLPDRKQTEGNPRIAATEEELCDYDPKTMIYVNKKAFENEEKDDEFSGEEEDMDTEDASYSETDMGSTDDELFEGAEDFDDFSDAPEEADF